MKTLKEFRGLVLLEVVYTIIFSLVVFALYF